MASTPQGARLTEAHRQAQLQVRNQFLVEFLAMWALLDSERLDETGPGWVQAVARAVSTYRQLSAAVGTRYFHDFAAIEAPSSATRPNAPLTPPPPAAPHTGRPPRQTGRTNTRARERRTDGSRAGKRPREDVIPSPRESRVKFELDERALFRPTEDRTRIEIPRIDWTREDRATKVSLTVTGPVAQKAKRGRGKSVAQARDESFVEAAGAAARHVLTGGRQSVLRLAQDDMRLQGYIRVTDSNPCYFCAMLASRGPVYRTPKRAGPNVRGPRNANAGVPFIGDGTAKVHDNCACTFEPVYTTDTIWPGRGREFQQLWNDHIRGKFSGDEAIREWRRVYTRLQREGQRAIA
jgi:hypothetical protein